MYVLKKFTTHRHAYKDIHTTHTNTLTCRLYNSTDPLQVPPPPHTQTNKQTKTYISEIEKDKSTPSGAEFHLPRTLSIITEVHLHTTSTLLYTSLPYLEDGGEESPMSSEQFHRQNMYHIFLCF